ncbi:MAG: histidine--tRNA ligase [Candidatus Hydrothermarchaeota archaeon]
MIHRPRGTRDFNEIDMQKREFVKKIIKECFESYGYREIMTPTFEHLELFLIKSGDEIRDSMYTFKDRGGRDLVLRPELTAPVIRFYVNELQSYPKPLKISYFGNCFRYERPQAGRFREFWQYGAECIGFSEIDAEAEVITMAVDSLMRLSLKDFELSVGHLGVLRNVLEENGVGEKHQNRIMGLIDKGDFDALDDYLKDLSIRKDTVYSIIDLKGDPESVIRKAKEILRDSRSISSVNYLEELVEKLRIFGLRDFKVDLGIARGLDYYTGMVFEIYHRKLGAQSQICGGGTYELSEMFGGEKTGTTGFAFGFDRIINALEKENVEIPVSPPVRVFIAPVGDVSKELIIKITQNLRKNKISSSFDLMNRKLSKNLSYADSLGIPYVLIVGEEEVEEEKYTLRDMRSGKQIKLSLDDLIEYLR